MFRCFVDSLIRPKNIANHINMKIGKLIGYLLLLILITSLPSIVTIFTSNSVPETYAKMVISELKNKDVSLDYTINNGELKSESDPNSVHIYELALFGQQTTNEQMNLVTYIVFNQVNHDVLTSGKMLNPGLVINLKSDKIEVSIFNPSAKENNNSLIASGTYEELEANGTDFSQIQNYSTYTLQVKIEEIIDNLFKPYLVVAYVASIPSAIISNAMTILFEILILVFFVFIFFRSAQLTFGELVKIITLCMTPTAVISLYMLLPLGNMWYYGLYFLGQIITIVYFYKSIRQVYINKMKKE